jgi:chromosome segregation protein
MRVKKLDLFGFKSFATRQHLNFGKGVTGVVGPNGCGKSNVVDALRWVMGEQNARHLRGSLMQDIIFCGSEKKGPLGFAEVILTIDNSDHTAPLDYNHYEEIQITRRLYKTGESEYEINKQKARLKDISDFFLGTGVGVKAYSIIEQGRISEVISAKPLERRNMIEEAAGITKYKAKKAIAERRMESTRLNLERIIDIRKEVDKRVNVLAKEKTRLQELHELKEKMQRLDTHVASHRYLDKQARLNYKLKNKQSIRDLIISIKQDIASNEQSFSTVLESYAKKHEERRTLEELTLHHQNARELLKKDIEYAQKTLRENELFVAKAQSQVGELDAKAQEFSQNIEKLKEDHQIVASELELISLEIDKTKQGGQEIIAERQNKLTKERDLQAKIVQAATNASRLQAEINALRSQEGQRKNELAILDQEIEQKRREFIEKESYVQNLIHECGTLSEREALIRNDLEALNQSLSELNATLLKATEDLNVCEETKRKLSSRYHSLAELDLQLEWSESGVSVLKNSDQQLIKGVVADVIRVKPGYEDIAEKCLAHLLDTALIEDEVELWRAKEILRSKKSSSTSFFILKDDEQALESVLGLSLLSSIVSIEAETFKSLESKLAHYYFADTLTDALSAWDALRKANSVVVTRDGEMLLPDGRAIVLGQNSTSGVLKRKNEQIELEAKIKELELEGAEKKKVVDEKKLLVNELSIKKTALLEDLKPASLGLIRLEESIKQKKSDLVRGEEEQKRLHAKRDKLHENAHNNDENIVRLQECWSLSLEEHRELSDEQEHIKSSQQESEENYERYQNELKGIEIKKASLKEKHQNHAQALASMQSNLSLILTQRGIFIEQVDEKNDEELKLLETARQAEKKLQTLEKELLETERQLLNTRLLCQSLSEQKEAKELSLAGVKSELDKLLSADHAEDLAINDLRNEISNIIDRISERYRVNLLYELNRFHLELIDEPSAKKEMDEIKRSLDRIGSVNENAAVEYEEFRNRQDFLQKQIGDLEDALNQLMHAINKINKTTKMRFLEAFNGINQQFQLVFPRLFNGGRAELILTNQEDMLNAGVDILAKPPGKNIGSIELMSGGEKALTAISLVMAIFLIKPSPFCLLDEVDAPLDEANVQRFSQLIKEMSSLSQFIVITHNRKTMEAADQLYGVTMEDAGMSKIVSVEVQDAFQSLRQKPPQLKQPKATQLLLDDIV